MSYTQAYTVAKTLLEAILEQQENGTEDLAAFRGAVSGSEADILSVELVAHTNIKLVLSDGTKFKIAVTPIL